MDFESRSGVLGGARDVCLPGQAHGHRHPLEGVPRAPPALHRVVRTVCVLVCLCVYTVFPVCLEFVA